MLLYLRKKTNVPFITMIYRDGGKGPSYIKRFAVTAMTRDKEYDLTNGT